MRYGSERRARRSVRLPYHDYSQEGAYFVTLCAYRREPLFGRVLDGRMHPSEHGRVVEQEWARSAVMRTDVELGAFVVMPDHFHGLVLLRSPGRGWMAGRPGPAPASLGAMIAGFKSAVTRRINRSAGTPGAPVWQRSYHEHVVRDEAAYRRIEAYIRDNPRRWWDHRHGRGA